MKACQATEGLRSNERFDLAWAGASAEWRHEVARAMWAMYDCRLREQVIALLESGGLQRAATGKDSDAR